MYRWILVFRLIRDTQFISLFRYKPICRYIRITSSLPLSKASEGLHKEAFDLQQQLAKTEAEKEAAKAAAAAAALSDVQHQPNGQQTEALAADLQRLQQLQQREEERHQESLSLLQQQ